MPDPVLQSPVNDHTEKLIVAWSKAPKKARDRFMGGFCLMPRGATGNDA